MTSASTERIIPTLNEAEFLQGIDPDSIAGNSAPISELVTREIERNPDLFARVGMASNNAVTGAYEEARGGTAIDIYSLETAPQIQDWLNHLRAAYAITIAQGKLCILEEDQAFSERHYALETFYAERSLAYRRLECAYGDEVWSNPQLKGELDALVNAGVERATTEEWQRITELIPAIIEKADIVGRDVDFVL